MARKGTRKSSIAGRILSPFKHLFSATVNTGRRVVGTAGNIGKRTFHGAKGVGNNWVKHSKAAYKNITHGRKGRSASRKGRSASRKGRKSSRKSTRRNRK